MNQDVIFNVPNFIGYIRIGLLVTSIYASTRIFILLYSVSAILDFFDGYTARLYKQSSELGACLDMITDRISTVIIGYRIVKESPKMYNFICLYVLIDLLSHFIQFNISAINLTNHKNNSNLFLKIYYNKYFLFPICFLSEAYFVSLLCDPKYERIIGYLYWCTLLKMLFHVIQLCDSICRISMVKIKK
jgi:CDP-diacylglycerol--inositol 3-phosphatidyltransferase